MLTSEKKAISFLSAIKAAMKENDVYSIVLRPSINDLTGAIQLEICIDGYDETLAALYDDESPVFDTLTSFLTIDLKNPTTCNVYEQTIDRALEKLEKGVSFLRDADLGVENTDIEQYRSKQLESLVGKRVAGEIIEVKYFGVVIRIRPGIFGRLHISDWATGTPPKVGDFVMTTATAIDDIDHHLVLRDMVI